MPYFENHLRSHVLWASTKRICLVLVADIRFSQTEVGDPYMPIQIKQDILRLDVPIDYAPFVQMLDSEEDLCNEEFRYLFIHFLVLFDVSEQLSSGAVLHNKHNELCRFKCEL